MLRLCGLDGRRLEGRGQMKKLVVLTTVVTLFAAMVGSATANHSWADYHWARTSNPFTVKLGNNLTGVWGGHLATASSQWSQSSVLDTTVVAGGGRGKRCRATSGRVEVCNGAYGNNGWLGIASIWLSGSHITQGTVKLNDTYFNTAQYNTPAWRNLVMCQEVGHTFGLDHQDENFTNPNLGTCMDYTNNPASNQAPNAHDYEQLETIYSHLDNTTTVGASAGFLPDAVPSFAAAQRVNRSTYRQDLGDDRALVTHVFWIE
jgi:hypothetical protein